MQLQEPPIAEEDQNNAICDLVYGQAQLSILFYCLDYATNLPCETQAGNSLLSDDEGDNPPPPEPMRGRTASVGYTSASAATERTPAATPLRRTLSTAAPAVSTRARHEANTRGGSDSDDGPPPL